MEGSLYLGSFPCISKSWDEEYCLLYREILLYRGSLNRGSTVTHNSLSHCQGVVDIIFIIIWKGLLTNSMF